MNGEIDDWGKEDNKKEKSDKHETNHDNEVSVRRENKNTTDKQIS